MRAGDSRFGAVFIGDGPERRGGGTRGARRPWRASSRARCRTTDLPAALAAADIGVAPFDPGRHGPLQLGFYWSPLKIFEYMAAGLPVVAPALPRLSRLVAHGAKACFTIRATRAISIERSSPWRMPGAGRRMGAARAERASCATSVGRALRGARRSARPDFVATMSRPLRILVTTDSFPPVCGGSGWSTWELVRGLSALGHDVRVLKIAIGTARTCHDGHRTSRFRVTTFQVNAPRVPVLRNLLKNERLWRDLTTYLVRTRTARATAWMSFTRNT